jgi:hypothetical protein
VKPRDVLLLSAFGLLAAGLACGQAPVTPVIEPPTPTSAPQATRVLSISASPRLIPEPTVREWLEATGMAYDAGARGAFADWRWSSLEDAPGVFNLSEPQEDMDFLGRSQDLTLLIGLQVVNTSERELPADLLAVPFDSPEMQVRFHRLIDVLAPFFDRHVRYLSVGNEVDVYLGRHPEEWGAYESFLDDASAYVHSVAPWIQVGTTITYGGATGVNAERVKALTGGREVLIFTYYPLDADFRARLPDAPLTDFPLMVDMAGGRPVILQEVGYPSSEELGSSERAQAEFVEQAFLAWQSEAERIPFLNYFLLHDLTPEMCGQLQDYYGLRDPGFEAFLCSLGLRQADGTPKEAWQTFLDATRASGIP